MNEGMGTHHVTRVLVPIRVISSVDEQAGIREANPATLSFMTRLQLSNVAATAPILRKPIVPLQLFSERE